MKDVNGVYLTGRLTRDPIIREFNGGDLIDFHIAVNDRIKKDGEWTDRADFFGVKKFYPGDFLKNIMKKGMYVTVAGKLRQRRYEKKDGTKGSSVEVVADSVVIMQYTRDAEEVEQEAKQVFAETTGEVFDDDIPF